MAYPLTSETGNLTCSAGSGDLHYLFGTAIRLTTDMATLNLESNEIEVTTPGASLAMHARINGLRTGTVEFAGIWPRASTPLGITSLVTYASGYVQYVNAWSIDIAWPEIDITYFAGGATGPTDPSTSWRRWMPGGIGQWSGSYTCKADDTTPPSVPSTGSAAAATFYMMADGAAGTTGDPSLAGNITTPRLTQRVRLGDFSELTYNFSGSGDLTQTAGTTFPGLTAASGAVSKPTWNLTATDSKPDNTCRLTVATGRYYEFPAFWTRLNLSWRVDDVVRVSGTLRVADVPGTIA